jgi:hypothetical protein
MNINIQVVRPIPTPVVVVHTGTVIVPVQVNHINHINHINQVNRVAQVNQQNHVVKRPNRLVLRQNQRIVKNILKNIKKCTNQNRPVAPI